MKRTWIGLALGAALLLPGQTSLRAEAPAQERREEEPAKAPGSIPPQRDIFVPVWTEPVSSDRALPADVRRMRADYVWTAVPLPAVQVEPAFRPQTGSATLLQIRRNETPLREGQRPRLAIVIRLASPRNGMRPFLEVVDSGTMLQSRAWGTPWKRTAQGAEWLFVVPDPLPPPSGEPNRISTQLDMGSPPGRTFEIHLVAHVPEQR